MKCLVDGDIVGFSCAIFNENFGWEACKDDIDDMMSRILETTGATEYACYITGQNNFRYTVNPEYKSNRRGKPIPRYRQDANSYLVTEYQARVTDGYEADDAIGIEATTLSTKNDDYIICSIDKDLFQIPGRHYNWRKNIFNLVEPLDGLRLFYRQMLTGDSVDGVPGVGGIGAVKSAKIINDLTDEIDMLAAVKTFYPDHNRMLINAQCLWILKEENGWITDQPLWKDLNPNS